jgi:hypothetical protein
MLLLEKCACSDWATMTWPTAETMADLSTTISLPAISAELTRTGRSSSDEASLVPVLSLRSLAQAVGDKIQCVGLPSLLSMVGEQVDEGRRGSLRPRLRRRSRRR